MREFGDGANGRNDIASQVNDALVSQDKAVSEPLAEHENLLSETKSLKGKLAAKRRETVGGDAFETKMYGAAYHLVNALEFVLDETTDVSMIDPETGLKTTAGNVGRDMFVNSIKRALNHLGMDGNGVKRVLEDS